MIPSLVAAADDFVPGRRCERLRPWSPLQMISSLMAAADGFVPGRGRSRPAL